MIDEETWMELRALHRQGWSISALAQEFNLNRRTVRRYVDAGQTPAYPVRACPADLTEEQAAYLRRRLATCSKLRATTLFREITELGYEASYVSFARRVRLLRATADDTEAEARFETDPGVQVQMDWTTLGCWPLATDLVELKALVAILGSRAWWGSPSPRTRRERPRCRWCRACSPISAARRKRSSPIATRSS